MYVKWRNESGYARLLYTITEGYSVQECSSLIQSMLISVEVCSLRSSVCARESWWAEVKFDLNLLKIRELAAVTLTTNLFYLKPVDFLFS